VRVGTKTSSIWQAQFAAVGTSLYQGLFCNNTATAVNTTTEGGGVAMAASWHGKQDVVSVSHHCSLAWLLFLYQQNE
jgi:hypothetical protein